MRVELLTLSDFRNYERCTFAPRPGTNLVLGANGSGKSNLLEAAALACTARSPRGARDAELVRWGCGAYAVRARVRTRLGTRLLAVSGAASGGGRELRVNGAAEAAAGLAAAGLPPVVWFGPDDLALVKGPPAQRRRLVHGLASQLDPLHAADLRAYARTLGQRNELLRDVRSRRAARELADLFDDQLIEAGLRIVRRRVVTLAALEPLARERHEVLAGSGEPLALVYTSGPAGERRAVDLQALDDLERVARAALAAVRDEELARGQTLWGPQRDDLLILLAGREARAYASQGQQRSIVLALKWGEQALLSDRLREEPLLLLDDVLSELDRTRALALGELLAAAEQAIVSTAERVEAPWLRDATVFRVDRGRVTADRGGEAPCPALPS